MEKGRESGSHTFSWTCEHVVRFLIVSGDMDFHSPLAADYFVASKTVGKSIVRMKNSKGISLLYILQF